MLGENSPEAQPIQEALKKGPSWREVGFHPEVHPKIAARIEKIQADLRTVSPATGCGELGKVARRSSHQCAGANTSSTQEQIDVEDPKEEVRRLRAQVAELQHERAARQEAEESRAKKARILSTPPLDLSPLHSGWGSAQCLRGDAHSYRCRRFYIERSSQRVILRRCLNRYGLRGTRVGEAPNPGPPKFLRRLRRGASTISESASTVPASAQDLHAAHRSPEVGVSPTVVDMSVDHSDREEPQCQAIDAQFWMMMSSLTGWIQSHARRRLVLVSQNPDFVGIDHEWDPDTGRIAGVSEVEEEEFPEQSLFETRPVSMHVAGRSHHWTQ